jgi:CHAT domain-containing protein/tetratricopeptide (TPR) repeat protein
MVKEEFLETLVAATDAESWRTLIKDNPEVVHIDVVHALKERADQFEQDDARQALTLGLIAEEIADQLGMDEARALACWIQANAHDFLAENEAAVRCYQRAAELFNAADKPLEASRTAIGQMFTLMQLGQFDRSQQLAESARKVFVQHGDVLSLAKIDMNLGSLYYQQGKYTEALEGYRGAAESFRSLGEPLYAAMNEINQATALTMLDDFLTAERLHEQARPIFEEADLRTAAASVEYDLALLQYARGDYAEAFRTFERARAAFAALELDVNLAMSDLGESNLYLDLNLPGEAQKLAAQAEESFAKMGMTHELARSKANHALALARLGQREKAAALLAEARELFASLENEAAMASADLQRAEVLGQDGRRDQAIELAASAVKVYEKLGLKTKQAHTHVLIAGFHADDRQWTASLQQLQNARQALGAVSTPSLSQRIDTGLGRVYEGMGDLSKAIEHYHRAANRIEQMTAGFTADEHRTAFVADKLAPYEALVSLHAASNPAEAFQWAEQAKSRALINLLSAGVHPKLRIQDEMDAQRVERLGEIRAELNWLYTRLTRGGETGETGAPIAGADTWRKIEERESEATSIWHSLSGRHVEELSLMRETHLTVAEIQAGLPDDTALVEYFLARGQLTAFVVTRTEVHSFANIAPIMEVQDLMEKLAFQFSKFQYGTSYYEKHRATLLEGTQQILDELGQKLLALMSRELASSKTLFIVPHGPLHALPFSALRLNGKYLVETHAISLGPSAAVLKFCREKTVGASPRDALLIGIPDERSPYVTAEIQDLSKLFGNAQTLLGEQATFEYVSKAASSTDVLHLATHGLFRPEAPLLSSIQLADRWMTVQDIYDLELKATLATLSACETGLGRDAGGDDLVGLARGFLYAGASSLLLSLWKVDDESITHLVKNFYIHWLAGSSKADALRQAEIELMKEKEHPYYWAPLVLTGSER